MSDSVPQNGLHSDDAGASTGDVPVSDAAAERLGAALGALHGAGVQVPPAVDAAVREEIRARFGRRSRGRRLRRFLGPVAVAAGLLLAVGVWQLGGRPGTAPDTGGAGSSPGPVAAGDPADFDGSGNVDILDAFGLARRLDAGAVDDVAHDLNRDGVVDGLDVEAIAMRAVALNGGAG